MTSDSLSAGEVLVVDDRPCPWPDLLRALADLGYVIHRGNGQITEDVARIHPDLVLLDAAGAGFELCGQIKAAAEIRLIPVIFITQADQKADRLRGFAVGAADYIVEPFWVEEAIARIQNQIHQQRLIASLQQRAQLPTNHSSKLLSSLHHLMGQQTRRLTEKNQQLSQEVYEREQAEAALRREQQKSEQLLLNILPRAVVDQLKQLQGTLAERFDEVTILFADIVNFTPLAAEISPLELVSWLNQIFSEFDRLTEQYGLEKIKTIGDAYMVVGGLPVPKADHTKAVMEMALAMQATTQEFTRQDGVPFQLRIGINTGPVVAGVIGIRKFSYDLWGDAVNIASRMEALAAPGKILVTEATYGRLRDRYPFEEVGQLLVKGRGYMTTYQYRSR